MLHRVLQTVSRLEPKLIYDRFRRFPLFTNKFLFHHVPKVENHAQTYTNKYMIFLSAKPPKVALKNVSSRASPASENRLAFKPNLKNNQGFNGLKTDAKGTGSPKPRKFTFGKIGGSVLTFGKIGGLVAAFAAISYCGYNFYFGYLANSTQEINLKDLTRYISSEEATKSYKNIEDFTFNHSLIARGHIEHLEVINKKWVRDVMVPGTETTTKTSYSNIGSIDLLERNLENAQHNLNIVPCNYVDDIHKEQFELMQNMECATSDLTPGSELEKPIERTIAPMEEKTNATEEKTNATEKKKNVVMSSDAKRLVAYHEAGHATAGWFLEFVTPVDEVSIIPDEIRLGYTRRLPHDPHLLTKDQLFDIMCVHLGGRISEELFFGCIATGAQNDLEKVTKLAYAKVAVWGMNEKVGQVSFGLNFGTPQGLYKPFSEHTAQLIDEEVRKLIDSAYLRTKDLLVKHKADVEKVAESLLKNEIIRHDDMVELLGPRPFK